MLAWNKNLVLFCTPVYGQDNASRP